MRYLLDTNIFIWSLADRAKLNDRAIKLLSSTASQVYLSVASTWELTIKYSLHKLIFPNAPGDFVPRTMGEFGYLSLEIQHAHAIEAAQLPYFHRDPFDRMLIAQARTEDMVLLTADDTLSRYDVQILACGN